MAKTVHKTLAWGGGMVGVVGCWRAVRFDYDMRTKIKLLKIKKKQFV